MRAPPKKIAAVTGTRAEYGLLYWSLKALQRDPAFELQLLVTGSHLSPKHGQTIDAILEDGFEIAKQIPMPLEDDTPLGMAISTSRTAESFARALDQLKPDALLVLGDRLEILAAAQAAFTLRIPIAHVHGGELTQGSMDDTIRHCLTKMAHLHFTAAAPYRQRVIQMGEEPSRVFNVGATGLESAARRQPLTKDQFEERFGYRFSTGLNFLATYHPATADAGDHAWKTDQLFEALLAVPGAKTLVTHPGVDVGSNAILERIRFHAGQNPDRVFSIPSLGQQGYLNALSLFDLVAGNSSSGLIEAPFFKKATVNVGSRQEGRLRASSVIDCGENKKEILSAIQKALSPEFQAELRNTAHPYGGGSASSLILDVLKKTDLGGLGKKKFHDLEGLNE